MVMMVVIMVILKFFIFGRFLLYRRGSLVFFTFVFVVGVVVERVGVEFGFSRSFRGLFVNALFYLKFLRCVL